jgi:aspartyl-tRNA(Asn)/glutamyl-tRNA(Gln) amidotransferase subunit A
MVLQVIAGDDGIDPGAGSSAVPDYLKSIDEGVRGVRLGIPSDWFFDICDPEVATATHAAARELEQAGAKLVPIALPSTHKVNLHAIEMTIMYAELASLHTATFARLDEYGADFRELLNRSQFVLAADYLHCLRARHLVQLDFERAFDLVDAIVAPGCVCVAPRHDHLVAKIGDEDVPLQDVLTRTTSVFNIVGLPRVTIPSGLDRQHLPISISIGSRPYDEAMALRVAHAFQKLTNYHKLVPPVVERSSHDNSAMASKI